MAKKNKRNESYLSIRKKLIAAVAMLLVASFMVASSSYAWFTLSTAPEVTGIQTTVGANGSLEIALIGTQGNLPGESQVGDGAEGEAITDKNLTWGNIVNLADAAYGLENIILKPARLSVNNDGTISTSILSVPEYGADGRITQLNATNTVSGIYNNSAFGVGGYGVRAVGTTTTMTRQQLVFNSAKSAAIKGVDSAKSTAVNSLQTYGPKLAKVLTAKAVDDGNATYDLACVAGIITDLSKANDALAAAIKAYYTAVVAKGLETYTDIEFNAALELADLENKSLADLIAGFDVNVASATVHIDGISSGTLYQAYLLWDANNDALTNATKEFNERAYESTGMDESNNPIYNTGAYKDSDSNSKADITEVKWADVSEILIGSGLVNIEAATLNGYTAGAVKDNMGAITIDVMNNGVVVEFGEGSGVYANIARATSDFDTNITFEKDTTVTLGQNSIPLDGASALMRVKTGTPKYNVSSNGTEDDVRAVWNNAPAKRDDNDADATIADALAYMIDLAFRTNAADSKLQLQTEATGRIYGNNGGTEETMGKGATMTFQSQDPAKFTTGQVQALMQAVRIVFVTEAASGYNIVAVAALDTNAAKIEGLEVTAPVKLVNATIDADGKVTYTTTETTTPEGGGTPVTTTTINWKEDASIMDLQQNTAQKLSVLVYLDGDKVTNANVATGDYSVTGTLNLQFSSSAELKPMEYAQLMNPDGTVSDNDVEVEASELTGDINKSMTTEQTLVLPAKSATDKAITWTMTSGTNARLANGKLTATAAGTVELTYSYEATAAEGENPATYTTGKVTVTVTAPFKAVTSITGVPTTGTAGTAITLTGTVAPADATNKGITWAVVDAEGQPVDLTDGNTFTPAEGKYTVTATVENGTAQGTAYTQTFEIEVSAN